MKPLLSDEHFSVDSTLIEAWASLKSFHVKDGSDEPPSPGRNGERDFRNEQRSNDTHASTTDPEAKPIARAKARKPVVAMRLLVRSWAGGRLFSATRLRER